LRKFIGAEYNGHLSRNLEAAPRGKIPGMKLDPEWQGILEELLRGKVRAVILTGGIGAGKTKTAAAMAAALRTAGHRVGGVISPRILRDGITYGYRVRDLLTGKEAPLCSLDPPGIRFRRFYFSPEGLRFAREAIIRAGRQARVTVVDEVGPWELRGGGFAPALEKVLEAGKPLILTVRPHLVEKTLEGLGLRRTRVLRL